MKLHVYSIEYREREGARLWQRASLTRSAHSTEPSPKMIELITGDARTLRKQNKWAAVRTFCNGQPCGIAQTESEWF